MKQSCTIRLATEADISEMYRISARAHQAGYQQLIPSERRADFDRHYAINTENSGHYSEAMRDHIQDPYWLVWIAEQDGRAAGYTLAHKPDDTHLYKKGLFVDPMFQGRGIGSVLLEVSLQTIEHGIIELVVIEENRRARYLYERSGFTVVGVSDKDFFGAHQVIMRMSKP